MLIVDAVLRDEVGRTSDVGVVTARVLVAVSVVCPPVGVFSVGEIDVSSVGEVAVSVVLVAMGVVTVAVVTTSVGKSVSVKQRKETVILDTCHNDYSKVSKLLRRQKISKANLSAL